MSIEYRESQFELFPGTANSYPRIEKPRFYFSSLTLNFDTIVVLSIVMVMVMVLSFSLGVERGKRVKTTPVFPSSLDNPAIKSRNENQPKNLPLSPAQTPVTSQPLLAKDQSLQPVRASLLSPAPQLIEKVAENVKSMYTVQVASFKQAKYAHQEAKNLKNKGYDIFVLQKGSHFIVGVGRFNQKDEAKVLSSKLKRQYKDCVIRNL